MVAKPKSMNNTANAKKVVAAPTIDAFQDVRASIIRARAARADDLDLRDATLSFTYDLWKADMTALAVLRESPVAKHLDVQQSIVWTESRAQDQAEEIIKATPETAEGGDIRTAVLLEHMLPILKAQDFEEWDLLPTIIAALEARRTELGLAPFVPRDVKAKKKTREVELMRAISRIGDILIGDDSMDAQGCIIAALRIVEEVESMQSA